MYSLVLLAVIVGSVSSAPYDNYDYDHDVHGYSSFGVQECVLLGIQGAIGCYFAPTPTPIDIPIHKSLGDQPEDFQKYVSPELKKMIMEKLGSSTFLRHSRYYGLNDINEDVCFGHVAVDTLGCIMYVESLHKPIDEPETAHYYPDAWHS